MCGIGKNVVHIFKLWVFNRFIFIAINVNVVDMSVKIKGANNK